MTHFGSDPRITHKPDCEGPDKQGCYACYCFSHHDCEPSREGDFKACLECAHVFRTAQELLDAHNKHLDKIEYPYPKETNASEVFCCPHCAHDF